jgi:polyhydroxyalkanoate synthase
MAGKDGKSALAPYSANLPMQSPEQFSANLFKAFEMGRQVLAKIAEDPQKREGAMSVASGFSDMSKLFAQIAQHWASHPKDLTEAQAALSHDLIELWGRTYKRFLGEQVEPVAQAAAFDPRFADKEWTENPFFDFLKQAYLISSAWASDMVAKADTVDNHTRHRAQFYLNQVVSALSPSNFPITNPEVLRTTIATNATNLTRGMQQLLEDLQQSGELLRIRQTDMSAFEVGRNLATTPGKVIYQNDVMQLIQYAPTTETVFEVPLVIVPPWINKYYILDLNPQKSMIKYLTDQGFTVFIVSWVNPDARLSTKSFEDYMREGVFAAVDAAQRVTGQPQVNTLGYCVGGTLLSAALAYMAATGDTRVKSSSFMAAQADFSRAGDLLVFIDDEQLKALENLMNQTGYLDGARMATVFNMLRPKDLIWPYIVNNYLLGKQPFPFDLLYWNADSTRMPPANHSFYLREFYQHNKLAKGLLRLGGVALDLSRVTIPIYHLATREDHIAPAQSVFLSSKLFGGPLRFVLAGSGHIAGVVNPPQKPKYMHWLLDETEGGPDPKALATVDEFVAKAREFAGSWWPDYTKWLTQYSGDHVPARQPGEGPLPAIEDAPGSYVRAA